MNRSKPKRLPWEMEQGIHLVQQACGCEYLVEHLPFATNPIEVRDLVQCTRHEEQWARIEDLCKPPSRRRKRK